MQLLPTYINFDTEEKIKFRVLLLNLVKIYAQIILELCGDPKNILGLKSDLLSLSTTQITAYIIN